MGYRGVSSMTVGESCPPYKASLLTLFILAVLVVVASYLLVLLMGFGFIFFTPGGLEVSTVFSFVWIIFVLCFIAAWKWRESFHTAIKKSFSRPFSGFFSNFLFIMPLLSGMLLTGVSAIIYFQESMGISTGEPSWREGTPIHEIFLYLTYAPVVEELGFRLIPFGLFIVFYVFLVGRNVAGKGFKLVLAALFYPDGAKRMAGLRNVSEHGVWLGISVGEWATILVTSVIYGYVHITSGSGWQAGKITSVFVQGFFFALTYLAYGFEAPILLHWFFNYYLFFFDPDVATKFFPTTIPILSIVELIILALGIAGWIVFAVEGVRKVLQRITAKHKEHIQ